MTEREKALRALPARPVRALLADLVAIGKRAGSEEAPRLPVVTLHLRSGLNAVGSIVDLTDGTQGAALVLRSVGGDDAIYLDPTAIEAVTVHEAAAWAHFISQGTVPAPVAPIPGAPPPPTRLEIKRMLIAEAQSLGATLKRAIGFEVDWTGVAESGEPLRALAALVHDTAQALAAIAGDALGAAAIAQAPAQVRFGDGPEGARLDEKTLIVTARLRFGSAGRLDGPVLRSAIERLY